MNKFAERLKELRIEENLTQTELAKRTGLTQTAIGKWEQNKRTPSVEALYILCQFFKVSADYLIGLED